MSPSEILDELAMIVSRHDLGKPMEDVFKTLFDGAIKSNGPDKQNDFIKSIFSMMKSTIPQSDWPLFLRKHTNPSFDFIFDMIFVDLGEDQYDCKKCEKFSIRKLNNISEDELLIEIKELEVDLWVYFPENIYAKGFENFKKWINDLKDGQIKYAEACTELKCELCDEGCKKEEYDYEECDECGGSFCNDCVTTTYDGSMHKPYSICKDCNDMYEGYADAMDKMDELHGTVEDVSIGTRLGGRDLYDTRTHEEKQQYDDD